MNYCSIPPLLWITFEGEKMDKIINKAVSELQYSLTNNFIDKLDILMELQDESENNELSNLVRYTRSTKDLKLHFLLDDVQYRDSAEKVFNNFFSTFTNTNVNIIETVKQSLYKSYVSLFAIESVNEDYIVLFDLFLNEKIQVEKISLESYSEKETFIFGRVADFNGFNYVIHVLNFLNSDMSEIFHTLLFEYVSLNFNKNTSHENKVQIIKKNSIDLFIVFGLALDSYEEIHFKLKSDDEKESLKFIFFEAEEIIIFDNFLEYITSVNDIDDDYIFYLLELIYTNFFHDKSYNFSSIKDYSYKDVFQTLTENGAFLTNDDFYNAMFVLKKMYIYFRENNLNTTKAINELNYVSDNVFVYQENLKHSTKGFYYDEDLFELIPDMTDFNVNINFREFLKYIELMHVVKSESKDMIVPTHLKNISKEIDLSPTKNVKNLNQSHFPLIDFFYNFAKEKSLIEIENTFVQPTEKIDDYLKLDEKEAYALFIKSFLNRSFTQKFIDDDKFDILVSQIKYVLESAIDGDIDIEDLNLKKDRYFIIDVLERFNLIEVILDTISITALGHDIYNYYLKNKSKNNKVINLFQYKKDL